MGRGEGEGSRVCVTGASGYIGSWIVKVLLNRGYSVNATIRTLNDPKKIDHLLALEGAKERLNLFEANLLEEGSFDSAVHECQGVFHTASPVKIDASNPQLEIVDPAVKGTLNVLSSCTKTPSIKRVVLTSSMVSVLFTGKPLNADVIVDETWFSDPKICEKQTFLKWYTLSKTLAEKVAWKFAKENGIDLVSINPAAVIGPWFHPTPTSSVEMIRSMIIGTETYPIAIFGWVNIKNVADAHVLAFENASASGRYILNEGVTHFSEVIEILHELYPTLKFPNKFEDDEAVKRTYKVCKQKVESLGIKYIPLKESLKETVDCLKEKNLVTS